MNAETEKRYFAETARALQRVGFQIEELDNGRLNVILNDLTLCEVGKIGGITYRNENVSTTERLAAKDKAYGIVRTVAEYVQQMEQAPPMDVKDLVDRYKVLADFNGTVLAGAYGKYGAEFVTWDWDYNRGGVTHGHYLGDDYKGAKQDFAIRSGLIPEHRIFGDEQLIEIYRCCADTLDAGYDLTFDQEKRIKDIQEQIEHGLPNIMDRIREQDTHTMEPPTQELTM